MRNRVNSHRWNFSIDIIPLMMIRILIETLFWFIWSRFLLLECSIYLLHNPWWFLSLICKIFMTSILFKIINFGINSLKILIAAVNCIIRKVRFNCIVLETWSPLILCFNIVFFRSILSYAALNLFIIQIFWVNISKRLLWLNQSLIT